MNAEQWPQIDRILQDALEREPDERAAFLDRVCANDSALRKELQSLIDSHKKAGNFLERSVPVPIQRLPAGTRIGSYVVEALIGCGGMGEVYRAGDSRLGRAVAIKFVRDEFIQRDGFRDRLDREARAIAALSHPHVCSLYDVGEHDGATYLVMEHVQGAILSTVLKKGALAPAIALRYAREIADALAAVHARGILQRDFKPGNVMITTGGVKVLDFGLAKFEAHETSPNSEPPTSGGTHPGMILGTLAYMSPEQAKGQVADKRTDIWAFGCVVYEMLTGNRAFIGADTTEVLANVLKSEPDWSALPAGLPAPIRKLLQRCSQKKMRAEGLQTSRPHCL